MAVQQGLFLTARQLVQCHSRSEKILPTWGKKEFVPTHSWLESKQVQSALDERKELLQEERVEKICNLAEAVWDEERVLARVTRRVGRHFEMLGHEENLTIFLYPEEALYLLENNHLELLYGGVAMSLQQAYTVLLSPMSDCTLDEYRVYSQLLRHGYQLLRHSPEVKVTRYERQIGLHRYYAPYKEKRVKREHGTTVKCDVFKDTNVRSEPDIELQLNIPSVTESYICTKDDIEEINISDDDEDDEEEEEEDEDDEEEEEEDEEEQEEEKCLKTEDVECNVEAGRVSPNTDAKVKVETNEEAQSSSVECVDESKDCESRTLQDAKSIDKDNNSELHVHPCPTAKDKDIPEVNTDCSCTSNTRCSEITQDNHINSTTCECDAPTVAVECASSTTDACSDKTLPKSGLESLSINGEMPVSRMSNSDSLNTVTKTECEPEISQSTEVFTVVDDDSIVESNNIKKESACTEAENCVIVKCEPSRVYDVEDDVHLKQDNESTEVFDITDDELPVNLSATEVIDVTGDSEVSSDSLIKKENVSFEVIEVHVTRKGLKRKSEYDKSSAIPSKRGSKFRKTKSENAVYDIIDLDDEVKKEKQDVRTKVEPVRANVKTEKVISNNVKLERELCKFYEEIELIDLADAEEKKEDENNADAVEENNADAVEEQEYEDRRTILDSFPNFGGQHNVCVTVPPSHLLPPNVCPQKHEYNIELWRLAANGIGGPPKQRVDSPGRTRMQQHSNNFRRGEFTNERETRSDPSRRRSAPNWDNTCNSVNYYPQQTENQAYGILPPWQANTWMQDPRNVRPQMGQNMCLPYGYNPTDRSWQGDFTPTRGNYNNYDIIPLRLQSEEIQARFLQQETRNQEYEYQRKLLSPKERVQRTKSNPFMNCKGRPRFNSTRYFAPATKLQGVMERIGIEERPEASSVDDVSTWTDVKNILNGSQSCDSVEAEDSDSEEITPLIKPADCTNTGNILSKLGIIKSANFVATDAVPELPVLYIRYDLYLPSTVLRKSKPSLPDFRLAIVRYEQPIPSPWRIAVLLREFEDGVPLLLAVVSPDAVIFFHYSSIDLPKHSTNP